MSPNPHSVTKQLEVAISDYTGARYAVAVSSCSMALRLAVRWCVENGMGKRVEIPKRTYVSVPQAAILAGASVSFRDEAWLGAYQLSPLPVYDSARWFTTDLFHKVTQGAGGFVCVSFHATKTLADTQGGAILHDSPEADTWFRRARFDGRTEGVAPKDDHFDMIAEHCYLSPDVSTRLLWAMQALPATNSPLPNDEYPDLSLYPVFTRSHT